MEQEYALLWSREANCFHVEVLEDTAASGLRFFKKNQKNDYLLIAFGSCAKVDQIAKNLRPLLQEREVVNQLYSSL